MSKKQILLVMSAALATSGIGCSSGSSSPLVGTWSTAATVAGFTVTETLVVNGDQTLSATTTANSTSCSGSWTATGYAWAATASSVTFSGTPTCTGSITCGNVSVSCSGNDQAFKDGSCTYALSNNDDTLALTGCSGTSDAT